jgi:glycosyltransferase involved in cell wall biosynthesis
MKILYHHRTQSLDGQRVHIRAIQDALRAAGHEVLEVAPVAAAEMAGTVPVPTLSRRFLGLLARLAPPGVYDLLELGYNLVGYRKLVAAIRRFRPDFIYERYCANTVAGVWASRKFGLPLLLEVNAPLAEEKRRLGTVGFPGLCRRLERYVFRHATRVLAVTGVLQRLLVEQAGLPPERVLVVQNGVWPQAYSCPDGAAAARRQALGLQGRIVVGAAGFFRQWHGIDLLLRCVARNPFLRERATVLLLGGGLAWAALKELARELGLADRVVFLEAVPHNEVPSYLSALDVAVIPRAVEYASPLKLFEYMAAGKAIVAPRQDNLMEILTEGADGVCFTPEDAGGLEEAVAALVRDDGLRRRLGEEARRTIERRGLTWEGNAARIVQVFGEVRAGRTEPGVLAGSRA